MEKIPKDNKEKIDEGRRAALRGLLASMGVALIPSKVGESIPQIADSEDEESTEELISEPSDSVWFDAEVDRHLELFERDLDFILEYGGKITKGDPQERTRLEYLREEFHVSDLTEEGLDDLREKIVGLAIQESRCDANRESESGAKGMLMIMPQTWNELADEGMKIESLIDSTTVAGRLFSQTYKHLQNTCSSEFEQIKNTMFSGNQVRFEKEFLNLVLMSAYHAGMGNLRKVLQGFAKEYPSPEKTVLALDQNEVMTGRDVFYLMVNTEYTKGEVAGFGTDSLEYVFKSVAALKTLKAKLEPEQLFALLGYQHENKSL